MRRAELMEAAAMRILAGLRETNMIQFMLAEQMGKDFLDWAEEFGQRFRDVYESEPDIKQAVDSGKLDKSLLDRVQEMISH